MNEPNPTPQNLHQQAKPKLNNNTAQTVKYIISIVIFTMLIFVFSMIMSSIASWRDGIYLDNTLSTGMIFNGPLMQNSPSLAMPEATSKFYQDNYLTKEIVTRSLTNTFLKSTAADVVLKADFIKKGLSYQPTYRTTFKAQYILENAGDKENFIRFVFPLPVNNITGEISNATLTANGVNVENAKSQESNLNGSNNILLWEGKVAAGKQVVIEASYQTVGLAQFSYEGIDNPKKSQDFNFNLTIEGTRSYNVLQGLSVDKREFGDNFVKLSWNKTSLYSKPSIDVAVGEKLNPGEQVARSYFVMAPVYLVFASILVFMAIKFAKPIKIFDLGLITAIYTVFFPLLHYLASFTIDPTMEMMSWVSNPGYYSMPLYAAFALAWLLISGLIFYYLGKIFNFKFAAKTGIPMLVLFLGFFPLVVTVPEYSMLLVLIGIVALAAIIVQTRIKLLKQGEE